MIRTAVAVLPLAFVLACSSQKPAQKPTADEAAARTEAPAAKTPEQSAADARAEIMKAMERELPEQPTRPVGDEEENFQMAVEGQGDATIEERERSWSLEIPIGTEGAMTCHVYKHSVDAGAATYAMLNALSEAVTIQGFAPVQFAAPGGRPALFVEVIYSTPNEQGQQSLGHVKVMTSTVDPSPIVCVHDELGYSKSFRRITEKLLLSLEPKNTPKYSEVYLFKVGELPLAMDHRTWWEGKDNQLVFESTAVFAIPRSKTELGFMDTTQSEVTNKDGFLNLYSVAKAENGELKLRAELERTKGGTYAAEGTKDGKEFKNTVKAADAKGIPGELWVTRAIASQLLSGKQAQLKYKDFDPDESLTALVETSMKREEGERRLSITSEGQTIQGTFDPKGSLLNGEIQSQGQKITFERIHTSGTPF